MTTHPTNDLPGPERELERALGSLVPAAMAGGLSIEAAAFEAGRRSTARSLRCWQGAAAALMVFSVGVTMLSMLRAPATAVPGMQEIASQEPPSQDPPRDAANSFLTSPLPPQRTLTRVFDHLTGDLLAADPVAAASTGKPRSGRGAGGTPAGRIDRSSDTLRIRPAGNDLLRTILSGN